MSLRAVFYAFQVFNVSEIYQDRRDRERRRSQSVSRADGVNDGERDGRRHRHETEIVGYEQQNGFRAEKNEKYPPIEAQNDPAEARKPLSAAEMHEKGKDVPENAGGAAQRKSERAFREDINRQPRCEKGFENVEDSGEKADAFSHRYDGVGSAGVH